MAVWERQAAQRQRQRQMPSFSSSLLDAIYHSIDDEPDGGQQRNNARSQVEEEIESLRSAIMVEKWLEHYGSARHLMSSNSGSSSTDSSAAFSSSETESSSTGGAVHQDQTQDLRKTSRKLRSPTHPALRSQTFSTPSSALERPPTNPTGPPPSRNHDLSKAQLRLTSPASWVKTLLHPAPTSPRGPSGSALSASSWTRTANPAATRACQLHHRPPYPALAAASTSGRTSTASFRVCENKNPIRHEFREFYDNESDVDDRSCASSDLFELETSESGHIKRNCHCMEPPA